MGIERVEKMWDEGEAGAEGLQYLYQTCLTFYHSKMVVYI